jgi:hypothetical protein
MSFWRRAPREVYRVYGDSEYLARESEESVESQPNAAHVGWFPGGLLAAALALSSVLVILMIQHGHARPATAGQAESRVASERRPNAYVTESERKASVGERRSSAATGFAQKRSRQAGARRDAAKGKCSPPAGAVPTSPAASAGTARVVRPAAMPVAQSEVEFGFER